RTPRTVTCVELERRADLIGGCGTRETRPDAVPHAWVGSDKAHCAIVRSLTATVRQPLRNLETGIVATGCRERRSIESSARAPWTGPSPQQHGRRHQPGPVLDEILVVGEHRRRVDN